MNKLRLIKESRHLDTYGEDINIFAKGLKRSNKVLAFKHNLPKEKKQKLFLIKGDRK